MPGITIVTMNDVFKEKVIMAIKTLLEQKHLYQNVNIDIKDIEAAIEKPQRPEGRNPAIVPSQRQSLEKQYAKQRLFLLVNTPWVFDTQAVSALNEPFDHTEIYKNFILLTLPTIKTLCAKCKDNPMPHNSGYLSQMKNLREIPYITKSMAISLDQIAKTAPKYFAKDTQDRHIFQTFFFPFQCQNCKGEPLVFMVRRVNLKIILVGRNHFEEAQIPKYLSKPESKFFRDSIVAYNTGNILAGLFYLRTFIEQYMRRVTQKYDVKISGEELGDEYARILADDFPAHRYKSLKKVYEELSVPLHNAEDSTEQYEISKSDIFNHFDQLRLIPLKSRNTN